MPIPKEILAVARPKNTIVICYGKNKDRYAVRKRVGCKYQAGRHLPVNGPTIGHIVNGQYIPREDDTKANVSLSNINLKDWGNIVLCDKLFETIKTELLAVYNLHDALKLYCIAILRVCEPGIKDYELKEAYESSFLSEFYPGVALSKNTVSTFLKNLGKTYARIITFMKNRAAAVSLDHHLLIDGTLKTNDSKVNSFSDFSFKSRVRGGRDISILYAFDLEVMEPVCSQCFPGNMLDATAYEDFISRNGITKGIIVGDKGFPESAAHEHFVLHPDLHYLNPIKRNSKLISRHEMLEFTGILDGFEGVTFRKEKCQGTLKWLYSFRDSKLAAEEERNWLKNAKKTGDYSLEVLRAKQRTFGTIVLECDLDLPPKVAYQAYSERWQIEIVMRYYKSACEFDETRVHSDYSVIGSEFCDFLATVLTFRLIKEFNKRELLETRTYKKVMAILDRAKKVQKEGEEWQLIRLNPSHIEILQTLELLPKPPKPPKNKRGRPKGSKNRKSGV